MINTRSGRETVKDGHGLAMVGKGEVLFLRRNRFAILFSPSCFLFLPSCFLFLLCCFFVFAFCHPFLCFRRLFCVFVQKSVKNWIGWCLVLNSYVP